MYQEEIVTVGGREFALLLPSQEIRDRIAALAAKINEDYAGLKPLFVVILNGAFMFAAELFRNLHIPCEITFVKLSSYRELESTGSVHQIIGLNQDVRNRHLVVVEDIVDTGLTMTEILNQLQGLQAASVKVATLLYKPDALRVAVPLDYAGFAIKNNFVVGYGLDYDGLARNLDAIYVLADT